jgi:hypothetical protein
MIRFEIDGAGYYLAVYEDSIFTNKETGQGYTTFFEGQNLCASRDKAYHYYYERETLLKSQTCSLRFTDQKQII